MKKILFIACLYASLAYSMEEKFNEFGAANRNYDSRIVPALKQYCHSLLQDVKSDNARAWYQHFRRSSAECDKALFHARTIKHIMLKHVNASLAAKDKDSYVATITTMEEQVLQQCPSGHRYAHKMHIQGFTSPWEHRIGYRSEIETNCSSVFARCHNFLFQDNKPLDYSEKFCNQYVIPCYIQLARIAADTELRDEEEAYCNVAKP